MQQTLLEYRTTLWDDATRQRGWLLREGAGALLLMVGLYLCVPIDLSLDGQFRWVAHIIATATAGIGVFLLLQSSKNEQTAAMWLRRVARLLAITWFLFELIYLSGRIAGVYLLQYRVLGEGMIAIAAICTTLSFAHLARVARSLDRRWLSIACLTLSVCSVVMVVDILLWESGNHQPGVYGLSLPRAIQPMLGSPEELMRLRAWFHHGMNPISELKQILLALIWVFLSTLVGLWFSCACLTQALHCDAVSHRPEAYERTA